MSKWRVSLILSRGCSLAVTLAREADCRLRNAGVPGAELLALLQAGGTSQLRALLGADVGYAPTDVELHKQWAFARWTLDKLAKNFLLACWRLRGAYLGELQVERGVLKHTPSKLSCKFAGEAAAAVYGCVGMCRLLEGVLDCMAAQGQTHRYRWKQSPSGRLLCCFGGSSGGVVQQVV